MKDNPEWCFQPTESRYYTKIGIWPRKNIPVIEGVFIRRDSAQRCPKKSIPATEIRWTMEKGLWIMVHMSKWGHILGHFWILHAPAVDFATLKQITGFKPYKPPAATIFSIPIDFE